MDLFKGYKIAAIMAQQRSGTHMLGSCLGSHPDIKYTGEIFCRNVPQTHEQAMASIKPVLCGGYTAIVLDTKYNQISRPVRRLLEREDVTVIHLLRRDLLALYFSGELHSYRSRNPNSQDIPTFQFDKQRFYSIVEARRMRIAKLSYLADLTLVYEDLTGGGMPITALPEWTGQRLCEALGVPIRQLTTDHQKAAPPDFLEYLEGWKEAIGGL